MFTSKKSKNKDNSKNSEELWSSFIDASLRINGNLFSDGDLHIEGQIDGDIRANELTIGHSATINGSIFADHIRISGQIHGDVTARVVEVFSSAHLDGNVIHESLAIEAGAHLNGLCKQGEVVPLLEGPRGNSAKPPPQEEGKGNKALRKGKNKA